MSFIHPGTAAVLAAAVTVSSCALSAPESHLGEEHPANPSASEGTAMSPPEFLRSYRTPEDFSTYRAPSPDLEAGHAPTPEDHHHGMDGQGDGQ